MSHLQEGQEIGVKALIEKHWDDAIDAKQMAETIVFTQQSRVLHGDNEFWTDPKVFCKRMLPIARSYMKEIANRLSAQKNRLDGDLQAAFKEKGVLGLDWKAMAELDELEEACQRIPVSKTAHMAAGQLVERKFAKMLLDYYTSEKSPELPLQAIYYGLLYWVHQYQHDEIDHSDEAGTDERSEDDDDVFNP